MRDPAVLRWLDDPGSPAVTLDMRGATVGDLHAYVHALVSSRVAPGVVPEGLRLAVAEVLLPGRKYVYSVRGGTGIVSHALIKE